MTIFNHNYIPNMSSQNTAAQAARNQSAQSGQTSVQDAYDSSASGGYGSSPDKVWSDKSQRSGVDMPLSREAGRTPDSGLIDQSLNGTNLKNEMKDAKQGKDSQGFAIGRGGATSDEEVWGVEKGAEKDF